jgi:hypothetical protein
MKIILSDYRMNAVCKVALAALLALITYTGVLGDERDELLAIASQGYLRDGRKVKPPQNDKLVLRYATSDDSSLADLARLIVFRDVLVDGFDRSKLRFGTQFESAVEKARKLVLSDSIRQTANEFLSNGNNLLSDAQNTLSRLAPAMNSILDAETDQNTIARMGLLIESLIAAEAVRLLQVDNNGKNSESSRLFSSDLDDYSSQGMPFASFSIANRSPKEASWAAVTVRLSTDYDFSTRNANNAVGQSIANLLLGGNAPDYSARDESFEKLTKSPKVYFVYVQNWKPNQKIEILTLPVLEYFNTARSAKIDIICADFHSTAEMDVTKHKKILERKYRK